MDKFFEQINNVQDILPIIDSLFSDDEKQDKFFESQKQLLFALIGFLFLEVPYDEQNLPMLSNLLCDMKNYKYSPENGESDTDLLFAHHEYKLANAHKKSKDANDVVFAYTNAKKLADKDLLIVIDKCLQKIQPNK